MTPVIENQGVDIIMRFHDLHRVDELERAVFSLVGQEMRPLRILLAMQRFSDGEAEAVEARLAPLLALPDPPRLTLLRFGEGFPVDARSALINLGFAAATARYVALFDYDDVLYPEAYRLLVSRLRATDAGIAFARVGVKLVDVFEDFLHVRASTDRFTGNSLIDLFHQNFCPIHSYVVDRARVPADELRFEPQLTLEEDYEFLLRVCARVRSDFELIGTQIGEYYYKTDLSNTIGTNTAPAPKVLSHMQAAMSFNESRRRLTVLSKEVQADLGVMEYQPDLTIRAFMDSLSA
nr:glycosyltransferase [uncultured Roseococcus sp.]